MDSMAATVLLVDDDPQIRSVFSGYLEERFEVRTADSGTAALEAIGEDVDVVLLDRRMPGMRGKELLAELRDRGHEQPVAMVTAVEPDFDIIDMGFDDYVVKPVFEDELQDVVETMLLRREYDKVIREYFALVSKVAALKRQKDDAELADDDRYDDSTSRLEAIKAEARTALDVAIESGKFDELFRDLAREAEEELEIEEELEAEDDSAEPSTTFGS